MENVEINLSYVIEKAESVELTFYDTLNESIYKRSLSLSSEDGRFGRSFHDRSISSNIVGSIFAKN